MIGFNNFYLGIEILTSIEHANDIDDWNKDIMWQDAFELEISNVGAAFKILEDNEYAYPGYRKSSGHIMWDVKMVYPQGRMGKGW